MRRTKNGGGFWLNLLVNLLLNLEWTIPAWILLALHFWLDWSIWWFVLALGLWLINVLFWTKFLGWAAKCSTPDPPKENKNPYSVGMKKEDRYAEEQ